MGKLRAFPATISRLDARTDPFGSELEWYAENRKGTTQGREAVTGFLLRGKRCLSHLRTNVVRDSWKRVGVYRRCRDHSCMGVDRTDLWIFGYMAAHHQYRNHHRHLLNGILNPEYAEP